jgi:predicted DNA-binding transcriptional regulator AlpA
MNDDLLDYAGVAALTGLSTATLRGYRAAGRMPAPDVMPAPDRPRWRESTITTWLADPEQRPGRGAPGRPRKTRYAQTQREYS